MSAKASKSGNSFREKLFSLAFSFKLKEFAAFTILSDSYAGLVLDGDCHFERVSGFRQQSWTPANRRPTICL